MSNVSEVNLIEPLALAAQLADTSSPRPLLVQVTSPEVFSAARIEGAVLVTPGELVCGVPPATGRLPEPAALKHLFQHIGYTPERSIVIYDDEGGGWAGRFGWTLDVIGHRQWSYLNGGLHAWQADGLPLVSGMPPSVTPSQVDIEIHTAPIAEIPDVLATIDDPGQIVWDARSPAEYAGLRQASARVGHIPGAVNLDWEQLKDPARNMRLRERLPELLAGAGIQADQAIITHCQTHHRSGLTYMVGRLLGYDIRAYHGSWSEWGNRDDTPIELPTNE